MITEIVEAHGWKKHHGWKIDNSMILSEFQYTYHDNLVDFCKEVDYWMNDNEEVVFDTIEEVLEYLVEQGKS